jgi:hypothetical protein
MPVSTFHCPHCAAALKTRDEDVTATPVLCPECRKPVLLSRNQAGALVASAPVPPTASGKPSRNQNPPAAGKSTTSTLGNGKKAPIVREAPAKSVAPQEPTPEKLSRNAMLGIAGAGAGVALLLGAAFFFWPGRTKPSENTANTTSDLVPDKQSQAKPKGAGSTLPVGTNQTANVGPKSTAAPTAAGRLSALGQRMVDYRVKHGHLPAAADPAGLPPSERLSWLAELTAAAVGPGRPAPNRSESWRSPSNDRFVRQQIPEFLNPSINRVTGAGNYPTTHFAGVAGVGADAADLPKSHPRAGIFGNARSTRIEDIRDGASNTLMVVGVTGDLGSWAAAGTPTVRALTREPYVNGPDGIGTGSPDRMIVLKADGSTQELSAKTDPRILRRMAAMADGLPLDPKVPGEPGDKSPQTPTVDSLTALVSKIQPGAGPKEDVLAKVPDAPGTREPLVAIRPTAKKSTKPAAPPAPKVDVTAALGQRVTRFEQAKPVPLRDVLNVLEELVTLPIRGDRAEIADLDDLLQTPVSFDLQNTTVAAILEAVLAPAKLTFQVRPDAIQLHRLGAEAGRPVAP